MSKTRILVSGANGQLGQELQVLAQQHPHAEWYFFDREGLDISSAQAVRQIFDAVQPQYCINAAAYTAVDAAETDAANAFLINAESMVWLADCCATYQSCLFYISTDYVYHGDQNRPYRESDAPAPKNVYARSKFQGEETALRANPQTYVLRTSWLYSSFGRNFVKTMLRLGQERDQLGIVRDQIGSPTYA
ncbi:MAG: dTDP-4-dehydrorhamnose reductase, partial [Phaeodactylibacter sp.]|nr:dTDP-4-dehydrorhamnose reductase [Phaeodactylibacter sp.]